MVEDTIGFGSITDVTAHLGDRLTVNWQWRFIGLL